MDTKRREGLEQSEGSESSMSKVREAVQSDSTSLVVHYEDFGF